ncbi:hypothetical protein [Streptomyces mesophilus]|uniref:hypothetical protein n=1 Tax=Streptomyces mesophilus TaxID=1775132 RepID=UPI0033239C31
MAKQYNLAYALNPAMQQTTKLLNAAGLPMHGMSKAPGDSFAAVLRDLRLLMGAPPSTLRTQQLLALTPALAAASKAMHIDPGLLRLKTHDAVAHWFLRLTERVDYAAYTKSELALKKVGLRGVFGGEGFELLVNGHGPLNRKLDARAEIERAAMNALVRSKAPGLVDARGRRIEGLAGSFDEVTQGYDVWIHTPGGRKVKFVDTVRLSLFRPSARIEVETLYLGLLAGAEIKLPGAAKSVGKQISRIRDRFRRILALELTVPGRFESAIFLPQQIVFNGSATKFSAIAPGEIDDVITRTTTTRTGADLEFDQYLMDLDVRELTRAIDLLFSI